MAYSQNHVIDPNFFDDAIEVFAFDYTWYVANKLEIDDLGRPIQKFDKKTIHASLQAQESTLNLNKEGNTTNLTYKLYCKSIYRITSGDFILYKNKYLHVDSWQDYDEWGVRQCSLTMVNFNEYKDFKEYIDYLNGDKIV